MKIAYLILCHIDPDHIARLVRKITDGTEHTAFVHVDAKSDRKIFEAALCDCSRSVVVGGSVDVRWGGFRAVEATVGLMKAAMAHGDYDRFVLMQGLEYPIKSNEEILSFFQEHPKTEFILAQNISQSKEKRETHKYRLFYFLDHSNVFPVRILHWLNHQMLKCGIVPHCKPAHAVSRLGQKMDIHQGCAQFALTREAVEYVIRFHMDNPRFNRYFRSVYAADEAYFHTIIYNSHLIENTPDGRAVFRPHLTNFQNVTFFEYPKKVTIFKRKEDWPKLAQSGFLFFRKATSESKELLDYIDEIHSAGCRGERI